MAKASLHRVQIVAKHGQAKPKHAQNMAWERDQVLNDIVFNVKPGANMGTGSALEVNLRGSTD